MSYIMECSFAAEDGKLLYIESSLLDNTYVIIKSDKGEELSRIALDDDDFGKLVKMLEMVKRQKQDG